TNVADNVVATISFSGGISVSAARAASGTCTVTTVVSCSFGSVGTGTNTIEIDATPMAAGNLGITAQATSANNTDTRNTVVGLSTHSIQQAIDNAVPGETIVVDPGTY